MTPTRQPFYAVRVVVTHVDTGSTSTRDYVRGERRMSRDAFASFALGDLLNLVTEPGEAVTFKVEEVDFPTVAINRQYNHTTHTEG